MQSYARIPSAVIINETDSYEKLHQRITTRVLALKITKQKELEQEKERSLLALKSRSSSLTEKSRQPSTFLSGVSIPNSTIKANMLSASKVEKIEDKNILRERRDASVREIIKRMESRLSELNPSVTEAETPKEGDTDAEIREKKEEQRSRSSEAVDRVLGIKDKIDPFKEQQRITRRTQNLAPLSCQRRPTYDSIKKAIENSKTCQDIVDVDSVDANRLGKFDLDDTFVRDSSFVARIPSLPMVPSLLRSTTPTTSKYGSGSQQKVMSKSSKLSKKSTGSSLNSRKLKGQGKRKKSILRRGSRDASKPLRNVSIIESKKEDSQTQTYLRMKDFNLRLRTEINIDV